MILNEKNLVKYGVVLGEPTMILNDFMSVNLCFSRKGFDYISVPAIIRQWWKLSFFWKKINKLFVLQNIYSTTNKPIDIYNTHEVLAKSCFNTILKLKKKKNKLKKSKTSLVQNKEYIWWKTLFVKDNILTRLNKSAINLNKFEENIISKRLKFLYVTTELTLLEYVRNYAISQQMFYSAGKWMPGLLSNFSKRRLFFESNIFSLDITNIFMPKMPNFVFMFNFNPKLSLSKEIFASFIPIFAICDTNSDPRISFAFPGNDNSLSSVYFYSKLFNKVLSS